MTPFRFVHTADLHLDSPFRGLSEVAADLQGIMREATFLAFERIVDLCLTRKVDALLIAGDLHDAADRSLRSLARMRVQFQRLAEHDIGVFMCHGNHDPLSGWEARFTWPDNVRVFGTEAVESKPLLKAGVEIARVYGVSYGTERVTDNLASCFKKEADAPWSIGLLHTNVGNDQNHLNYAPCEIQDLKDAGMDYWALGHIHAHRVVHEEGPTIVYPGNPQGRNPRESGPRGCYVVEVDNQGRLQGEFVPVDLVRWHHESVSIEGITHLDGLLSRLEDRIEELRREAVARGAIVRWSLTGRGLLHRELARPGRAEDLLATLRERCGNGPGFVWSESVQDFTGRELDLGALRAEENLVGDFLRLAGQVDASLVDELEDSLKILLGDPRVRRHLHPPDQARWHQWVQEAEQQGIDRLIREDD